MKVLEVTREELSRGNFVVIIPVGSIEQHGPHLPLGTDSIIANYVASEVEGRFPNLVLLYPVIAVGSSMEHVGFKGTTWVRFESLLHYLLDIIESVFQWGVAGVVFVNGHGGNVDVLNMAIKTWNYSHGGGALHYYIYNNRVMSAVRRHFPVFGHADAVEASLISAINKDLVKWDRIVDVEVKGNINVVRTIDVSQSGVVGILRKDLINPSVGTEILKFIVEDLINQLREHYPGVFGY
ncbi:MAG: creatininase family protein [Vulcanisaeta sp. AZ3]|nr:MAG: creatininase [Vulcanisaeta sp. AZ3]